MALRAGVMQEKLLILTSLFCRANHPYGIGRCRWCWRVRMGTWEGEISSYFAWQSHESRKRILRPFILFFFTGGRAGEMVQTWPNYSQALFSPTFEDITTTQKYDQLDPWLGSKNVWMEKFMLAHSSNYSIKIQMKLLIIHTDIICYVINERRVELKNWVEWIWPNLFYWFILLRHNFPSQVYAKNYD